MLILPKKKPGLQIEDVFSIDLWTGNGSTQSITNGLDMSGEGGMVWCKERSAVIGAFHALVDTERGPNKTIASNSTNPEATRTDSFNSFNSDGYTLGADAATGSFNFSGATYVGWSFRKAPKFFDVVTYTGDGTSNQTINHGLLSTPGFIVVKRTDSTQNWICTHRGFAPLDDYFITLNSTGGKVGAGAGAWGATSTKFEANAGLSLNTSGATYVAYLFAHDDSASGIIQCGSYTGNGSTSGPTITTGHETQWLLVKRTDSTGDWRIYDSVRDATNPRTYKLLANSSAAEDTAGEDIDFNVTNFQIKSTDAGINASGGTYIYVEIKAAA